jgi:hypothetical protein
LHRRYFKEAEDKQRSLDLSISLLEKREEFFEREREEFLEQRSAIARRDRDEAKKREREQQIDETCCISSHVHRWQLRLQAASHEVRMQDHLCCSEMPQPIQAASSSSRPSDFSTSPDAPAAAPSECAASPIQAPEPSNCITPVGDICGDLDDQEQIRSPPYLSSPAPVFTPPHLVCARACFFYFVFVVTSIQICCAASVDTSTLLGRSISQGQGPESARRMS